MKFYYYGPGSGLGHHKDSYATRECSAVHGHTNCPVVLGFRPTINSPETVECDCGCHSRTAPVWLTEQEVADGVLVGVVTYHPPENG